MRKLILAAFAAIMLTTPAHADFAWKHFGADKFANSESEAMAKRESVFRKDFGFSEACTAQAMQVTSGAGTPGKLNVGDRLAVMMSGGEVAHRNTVVAFEEFQHGIQFAATTVEWTMTCGGRTVVIKRPDVCFNWSFAIVPAPKPPAVRIIRKTEIITHEVVVGEQCSAIHFHVSRALIDRGVRVKYAIIVNGYLPQSGCDDRCDGTECHQPTHPCDDFCHYMSIVLGIQRVYKDDRYGANYTFVDVANIISEDQTIWVSRAAENSGFIAICLSVQGIGDSTAELIVPPGVTFPAGILSPISVPSLWNDHQVDIPSDKWPSFGMGAVMAEHN